MNSTNTSDIAVAVFANRKDFFFTKLCIASIRYYYPEVEILLVKDRLNGDFDTNTLCRVFSVKVHELSKRYFGWSAAKIFFLLDKRLPRKRYLCMDSDIIFIGNLLHKLNAEKGDFVLHPEIYPQPFSDTVKGIFLDEEKIKPFYPEYQYPGFFFNAGQTVVTPGMLEEAMFSPAFDTTRYPYYRNPAVFPLVDQSILNIVIPISMRKNHLKVSTIPYMLWSVEFFGDLSHNSMSQFEDGSKYPFLVHYAGDVRTWRIEKMKGPQVLSFFRQFYHTKLSQKEIAADAKQDERAERKNLTKSLYYKNRILLEIGRRLS